MKPIAALAALSLVAIAACVPRPKPAPPVETRPHAPPAPAPAPAPVFDSWADAPQTAGDWRYADGVAQFAESGGAARFTMRCDPATRTILLSRVGAPSASPRITIRTESQTRTLAATATTAGVEWRLAASDRLLDAMALSKGRFAVEAPGQATLYLPSWAEVTRVIEDCR